MITGICLPGGGAAGANQAGMLMALRSLRHHVSFLSAASVGGLNGALFVANRMRRLEEVWRGITPKQVFRKWSLFVPRGQRFLSPGPLERLLREELATGNLPAQRMELFVSAVEFGTGDTFTASSKGTPEFWRWLMASASLPAIFGTVEIDGRLYVDGGVADNTPLKPLVRAGCDRIIVLHCHPSKVKPWPAHKPPTRFEQVLGLPGLFMKATQRQDSKWLNEVNRQVAAGTAAPGRRHIELIEIFPETEVGTLEFDSTKTQAAITSSRRIAAKRLEELLWEKAA